MTAMGNALAMEWQKLRPFGKTSRTVALTIGLAVSVSAIVSAAMASGAKHMTLADRSSFDSVGISLQGVNAAVLAIAAFGVLSMTREYSTGMISLTFLAQPRRLRVLAAKLVTHSTVAAIAGLGACLAAFAVPAVERSHRRQQIGADDQAFVEQPSGQRGCFVLVRKRTPDERRAHLRRPIECPHQAVAATSNAPTS